jgi:hypothetical protein
MHLTRDDFGPGLHVLRDVEPLKRAGAMAAELGADLCATLPQAEAALQERSSLPSVDATQLAALEVLARRLARAQRIALRTRERAVEQVEHRLADAGAGLAVHPTTIRDRAAAVEAAHRALDAAEAARVEHEGAIEANAAQVEAESAEARATADRAVVHEAAHRRRHPAPPRRRARALSIVLVAFGGGLVAVAAGAPPWVGPLPGLLACLVALRYIRPHPDDDLTGREEASTLLSQVSARTEELFGARRATRELEERRLLLEAARDRAAEDLRVAARAWAELAGEGVDPAAVEDVVRRYDPQHEDARALAGETVGVRTAEVVQHHVEQRWLAAWADLDRPAPAGDAAEDAVRELVTQATRPIVLVGPATARATELARLAPAAAVVVLDGADESA